MIAEKLYPCTLESSTVEMISEAKNGFGVTGRTLLKYSDALDRSQVHTGCYELCVSFQKWRHPLWGWSQQLGGTFW